MDSIRENASIPNSMIKPCILQILEGASEEKPLTQNEIRQRLKNAYGIKVDRKTLRRHLVPLVECFENIRYREVPRIVKGEQVTVMTDFWLEKESLLTEGELRALIYSVVFSKHMTKRHKESLVEVLRSLPADGNCIPIAEYDIYEDRVPGGEPQLFLNIEDLSKAIHDKRRITFSYKEYGFDKKMHVREQKYTVSPLGIGEHDGDFYLVAIVNGVENDSPKEMINHLESVIKAMENKEIHVDVFRIDRIQEIVILDEEREKLDAPGTMRLRGKDGDRLNVQEHLIENPALRPGYTVQAKFRLVEGPECSLSDVVDFFNRRGDIRVNREAKARTPGIYTVTVHVNNNTMRDFALKHAANIEVLEPGDLREDLFKTFKTALARMTSDGGDEDEA